MDIDERNLTDFKNSQNEKLVWVRRDTHRERENNLLFGKFSTELHT